MELYAHPLNDSPGLILTIADGLGTFAQETRDLPELTELEIPTEFGNRDKIQIKGIWTLPGDAPFYSTYYPVLLSDKNLAGIGTPGIVDLEADGTAALDITTVFTTQNGGTVQPGKYEFYIAVTDSQRGLYSVSDPIEITLSGIISHRLCWHRHGYHRDRILRTRRHSPRRQAGTRNVS